MSDQNLLNAMGIYKEFNNGRDKKHILCGVDLQVNEGDIVAISGRSGSGKTSLLQILAGLDKPTSGKVELLGIDINSWKSSMLNQWKERILVSYISFIILCLS